MIMEQTIIITQKRVNVTSLKLDKSSAIWTRMWKTKFKTNFRWINDGNKGLDTREHMVYLQTSVWCDEIGNRGRWRLSWQKGGLKMQVGAKLHGTLNFRLRIYVVPSEYFSYFTSGIKSILPINKSKVYKS